MKTLLRTTAAFVMLASLAVFGYCLYRTVKPGNCVSGGPYISEVDVPECPASASAWVWIMQGAVVTGVCALGWFLLIGRLSASRPAGRPGRVLRHRHATGPYPSGMSNLPVAPGVPDVLGAQDVPGAPDISDVRDVPGGCK